MELVRRSLAMLSAFSTAYPEDPAATVKKTIGDGKEDAKYTADVHVKVIGSNNGEFTSGQTDLRGVFIADAINGTSTVIAQAEGGQYAFFRGKTYLGQHAVKGAPAKQEAQASEEPKPTSKMMLLENVFRNQIDASRANSGKLQQLYDNTMQGV